MFVESSISNPAVGGRKSSGEEGWEKGNEREERNGREEWII